MNELFLLKLGEIILKGSNRRSFEDRLRGNIARKIGTLETSILPYEDCCTVFTPKHPRTKPTLDGVLKAEAKLDRGALIERALQNTQMVKVKYYG